MKAVSLPESLQPFLGLFEKWGDVTSDTTRYKLLDLAEQNPIEMQELLDWHTQLSQVDKASYKDWLDGSISLRDMTNYERAKVYFTFWLMYAELEVDKFQGDARNN